jgi:hypothetical protein
VVLVLFRQWLGLDFRGIVDVERTTHVGFEIVIAQPTLLKHHPVPLASLLEGRVNGSQRFPVPSDGIHGIVVEFGNGLGPPTHRHVLVLHICDAVLYSSLIANL